jgi:PAS domain S-box-containing protein
MGQGVVYQDTAGRILDANPAAERILGLTLAQMQGRTSTDPRWRALREDGSPFPGEEHPSMLALRTGRPVHGQVMGVFHPTDERTRWILIDATPELDEAGQVVEVFTTFSDITALRAAEAQALDVARRFDRVFECAPWNGVFYRLVRDEAGEIVDWELQAINPPAAASIGGKPADFLGRRATELFGPEVMRDYITLSREVVASGAPRTFETYFEANQRHYVTSVFLVDADHYANIALDITEQKRAEAERGRLQAQVGQAQKMESVGRLAAGVAHDFNNLLMAQKGFSELLRMRLGSTAEPIEELDQIEACVDRAAVLTRQLLAFSRNQPMPAVVLDLNELVQGLVKLLQRLIGADVAVTTALAPAPALVVADPGQLEQVVVNLAVNARDAMPEGGRLAIRVSLEDGGAAPDERRGAPVGAVVLSVADTGCGMDEETCRRAFEPFFTTKPVGKGTGLGLSVVHDVVEQCGGSVSVESAPGRGTDVRVTLPRAARAASVPAPPRAPSVPASGELVLVVDDDPVLRTLAQRMLEPKGFRVAVAPHAEAALRLVGELGLRPDVVLTDVVMPGMSGRALADRLAELVPGLPVVVMSGHAGATAAGLAARAGGPDFLPKPFSSAELAAKLRAALARR